METPDPKQDQDSPAELPRDIEHDEVKEAFIDCSAMDHVERDEYLNRRFADTPHLRERVLRLLEFSQRPLPYETLADDLMIAHLRAQEYIQDHESHDSEVRIGPYRIIERIGEGGFGVVYRAHQVDPVKREVAVKVLKLGMDTSQVVRRFQAEQQAMAMMDHPSIAKVFDAGLTLTGRPYFVMELIHGQSITEYCTKNKLTLRERLVLFKRVCSGMHHAHQKGVIHRDVKPSNILVTEISGEPIPKIIDFGIAKATSTRLTEKTIHTELNQMVGTPEYMSPEQAEQSSLGIDSRSDVYSLGAVLYKLLTGLTPFDAKQLRSASYAQMQRIIRNEYPLRPSTRLTESGTLERVADSQSVEPNQLRSLLQNELDWVIMRCLRKIPDERYGSVLELERDIDRFLGGVPVEAVPPTRVYLAKKFYGAHRTAVITAFVILFTLLTGFAGTMVGFANARHQQAIAKAESLEARRQTYVAQMQLAWSALGDRPGRMRGFLDKAPVDQRGWEWYTLRSRLDTSTRVIGAPLPTNIARYNEYDGARSLIHPKRDILVTVLETGSSRAQVWDLYRGELKFSIPPINANSGRAERGSSFCFTPDGKHLLHFDSYRKPWGELAQAEEMKSVRVQVWDVSSGSLLEQRELEFPGDEVFLPDPTGRSLLYADSSGMLSFVDIESGAVIATKSDLTHPVADIYFSPMGESVLVTGRRGECSVLSSRDLTTSHLLNGHSNYITTAKFSINGNRLITGSLDRTARVWNLDGDTSQPLILSHDSSVLNAGFSTDASVAFTESDTVQVWESESGSLLARFAPESLLNRSSFLVREGNYIGSRELKGDIRLWHTQAQHAVNLNGHVGHVNFAKFTGSTGYILSGGWDGWKANSTGAIRIWDAETGIEVAQLGQPGDIAIDADVTPDGRFAVVAVLDGPSMGINIIDLVSGKKIIIPGKANGGVAIHPKKPVAAVVRDSKLILIDIFTGAIVIETQQFVFDGTRGMEWNSDGSHLAIAIDPRTLSSFEQEIIVYDEMLNRVHQLHGSSVTHDPNTDDFLIFDSSRDVISTYDPISGRIIRESPLPGIGDGLVEIRSNGSRLAASSPDDGAVMLWDIQSLNRVAVFQNQGYVSDFGWSPDGERLIVTWDERIQIWDRIPLGQRTRMREMLKNELLRDSSVSAQKDTPSSDVEVKERAAQIRELQNGLADPT